MEREACVCDHGFERSDLCAEIIIIIIIIIIIVIIYEVCNLSHKINQNETMLLLPEVTGCQFATAIF